MAAVSSFLPQVMVFAPTCPEPLAVSAVVMAADRFCRLTHAWEEDLDATDITAGTGTYDYDLPVGALLEKVLTVRVNNIPVRIASRHEADAYDPMWTTRSGGDTQYAVTTARDVTLVPAPDKASVGGLKVKAALRPKQGTTLPDVLYDEWRDAIAAGALAYVLSLPQAWGNPALAAQKEMEFQGYVTHAKAQGQFGHNSAQRMVAMRPFVK